MRVWIMAKAEIGGCGPTGDSSGAGCIGGLCLVPGGIKVMDACRITHCCWLDDFLGMSVYGSYAVINGINYGGMLLPCMIMR